VVVIPNLMGICLWSPPLDKMGNSTRGVAFCQKLIERFNFHNYDSLLHADSKKIDPRRRLGNKETDLIVSLLFACKHGDLETVRRLYLQGANLNIADYDGRTALHLAACEGHSLLLKFLLYVAKVEASTADRWGRTALDDARTFHQTDCVALLVRAMSRRTREHSKRMSSIGENHVNGLLNVGADTEVASTASAASSEEEDACGIMMLGNSPQEEKHFSEFIWKCYESFFCDFSLFGWPT
jgi:glutaminase